MSSEQHTKTIAVDAGVYKRLSRLRTVQHGFSDVIKKLLDVKDEFEEIRGNPIVLFEQEVD